MNTLLTLAFLLAAPDAGPALKIDGDGVKATALSLEQLKALGATAADWADQKGAHRVAGVRLDKVLAAAGLSDGPKGPNVNPKEKHAGLRAAVVASAADGYQAVFSAGELLESVGATNALVIWELDGQPLGDAGPLRIVVLTDKEPARSIRSVTALHLVSLSKR